MALPGQSNGDQLEVVTFDDPRPKSTPPSVAHQFAALADSQSRSPQTLAHRPKIRFSIDASALMPNAMQTLSRSPVNGEASDHGHITGLRRIRQQHGIGPSPSQPSSEAPSRVGSLSLMPSSPIFGSCEDLAKFPSESLHSFSFAQQTEDHLHSRQSIVKRGLEFMKDRLGMTTATPSIVAQVKANGDEEVQSVMSLLERANVFTEDKTPMMVGPASGPADIRGNPFDKSFSLGFDGEEDENMEKSEGSSNTGTNESHSTTATTPPVTRAPTLKRTYTDLELSTLKSRLDDALAEPYMVSKSERGSLSIAANPNLSTSPVHGHALRGHPASEAIFTTDSRYPWTILAANDMACLVFGITKSEVRKIGILEVVKEERREWLKQKLQNSEVDPYPYPHSHHGSAQGEHTLMLRDLPNKQAKRSETAGWGNSRTSKHAQTKSRGVILCGDVVPIQKRNGNVGTASLWVKEKKGGLIWVMEEISEDMAYIHFERDSTTEIDRASGKLSAIFGDSNIVKGTSIKTLIPSLPCRPSGELDMAAIDEEGHYTASNRGVFIPCFVDRLKDESGIRVSSFPHMAGIIVLSTSTLTINSCNSVFTNALFGLSNTIGQHIDTLLPGFDNILRYITDVEKIPLVDGMVIPEHLFRKARAAIARREDKDEALYALFRPSGLTARHRDGSELRVDVQMRVVQSETSSPYGTAIIDDEDEEGMPQSQMMFALWITYSRHFHAVSLATDPTSAILKRSISPPRQPSPGQPSPPLIASPGIEPSISAIEQEIAEAVRSNVKDISGNLEMSTLAQYEARKKKKISDFIILEDMGQGAYGQVKLARHKKASQQRVVLKYVTKKRILVDTWTRDRKLGTVPLEIHILNYLKESGLQHPNIVEMIDFFEDDVNYYIEMVPHGLPGMDLFDYIELMINMDENEARSIFVQVARAVYHLHIRAGVVHRDIKDENVVLDGNGRIKLIDFGSAAFISKGPFDVFVGTIDYAAPETLQGHSYVGEPQDIWALGVLLYTICYKENPFYNVDEIMDHEIRIPYLLSDRCLDLIRGMLDRDVERRLTIEQVLAHPWFEGLPGPDEAFKIALEEEAALKRNQRPPILSSSTC